MILGMRSAKYVLGLWDLEEVFHGQGAVKYIISNYVCVLLVSLSWLVVVVVLLLLAAVVVAAAVVVVVAVVEVVVVVVEDLEEVPDGQGAYINVWCVCICMWCTLYIQ